MYQPQPGIRQIRRQQFLAKQAQEQRERDARNQQAHAAVIASVKK